MNIFVTSWAGMSPYPPTPTPGPSPSPTAIPTPTPAPNALSVVLNLPLSNVLPDEVCIGEFSLDNVSATVTSVPNGWSFIRSDTTGATGITNFWYWYTTVGNGNDPTSPTWGLSQASGSVSWTKCIGGIDPNTPIDPNNPSGVGANDPSKTGLTVPAFGANLAQSGELIVFGCSSIGGGGANPWSSSLGTSMQIVGNPFAGVLSASGDLNAVGYINLPSTSSAPGAQTCAQSGSATAMVGDSNRVTASSAYADADCIRDSNANCIGGSNSNSNAGAGGYDAEPAFRFARQ